LLISHGAGNDAQKHRNYTEMSTLNNASSARHVMAIEAWGLDSAGISNRWPSPS